MQHGRLNLGTVAPRVAAVAGMDTAADRLHLVCSNGSYWAVHADGDPDERRHHLFDGARHTFALLPRRTLVVIEEPIMIQNGKTTRLLGMAAGAIWAASLEFDIFTAWADIAAWKKSVVGKGNATKGEIGTWVHDNLHMVFDEQDYYDAACLMRYGEICLSAQPTDHS